MIGRLWQRLHDWERSFHASYSHDIGDPAERKRSAFYVNWLDHGVLRTFWTNHAEVAPGVFRSNHPAHERLSNLAAEGFRTILNLRGAVHLSHHKFEEESCAKLGMTLVDVPMSARRAPEAKTILELIRVLGEVEKPVLMHCKSGADRAGLASAIYLLHFRGASLEEARKQLSPRFLHFRQSKTGILDHVLDLYEARLERGPIAFADWVATEYDNAAAMEGFAETRAKRRGSTGNTVA